MSETWPGRVKFIQGVPGGSTLEAWLEPEEAPVTAGARVLTLAGEKIKWSHSDLVPGPADLEIEGGIAYRPHFFLLFFDEATVEIHVRVTGPDDSVLHDGMWVVAGDKGDEAERKLFLSTT